MSAGPARVLEALRSTDGGPCSGEAISSLLEVSRAQIWKHVETLRRRGYRIEDEPGGGYRLTEVPDRLYPEELAAGLETAWLARRIEYLDTTDSTNRVALELGRGGAEHGTTVVAEHQSAGRGRLGRSFFSPAYQNLYTSVVLRPALTTSDAPTLILAAAVAVADAVAATVPDPDAVEIKWPNDVLLGGLKTCGILMEMSAEATRVGFAVLGIGVNLNVERDELPDEFRHRATSLRSHRGTPVDRTAFACRLYGSLEEVMDAHADQGFAALRSRFESRFRMPGRRVRVVDLHGAVRFGVARGITESGALEIDGDDGKRDVVIAGDVTLTPEEEEVA
ncbi:MAG: biotin--[acetyl-CoA-carboxylase] ligase [Proteobacteria bacterium]|nr:biotin--[acetyl-CoA-carboxylase] ligase [Pseudomonadota bacterium]